MAIKYGTIRKDGYRFNGYVKQKNGKIVEGWYSPEAWTRKILFGKSRKFYNIEKKYGLTEEAYHALLKSQNYQCAICYKSFAVLGSKQVVVDHCHKTKKVRAILCGNCNTGIGLFRDSPELLKAAIDYIIKYSSQTQ